MVLETDRLLLLPLTARQLGLWINDIGKLERELQITYDAEPMGGFFGDIVKGQLDVTNTDEKNYLFHSFWFLIRISDRVVVGSADFKGIPNQQGEVEIGYGLGTQYEHYGYMTEAVMAMCRWSLDQKQITRVIAETERDGEASQRVLKRCGFQLYKEGDTMWWHL